MATIRRAGFGTVFELEDSKVGIGTDAATHTLQALGNIRSEAATDVGISSLATYQGFVDKEARFSTGQIDIESQSGATLGEIVIDGDVTVSSATTFTSGPQHLTVTATVTLPSGDTNSRELKPTPGSFRFNQDFATLEFYTGNNWAIVNTFPEMQNSPGNRGRGVVSGGRDSNLQMQFINIASKGNSQFFGKHTGSTSTFEGFGLASETRGIFAGTYPGQEDIIEYITIASEGNSIDFGNLTDGRRSGAGASSSTRGLFAGGISPSDVNIIDYIEIATIGNALDFGDLNNAGSEMCGFSDPVRSIFSGGDGGPNHDIQFVITSSKGNAVKTGDLTRTVKNQPGASNQVRGLVMGGYEPTRTTHIDAVSMASMGNAVMFGDLTQPRGYNAAVASQTRACSLGGNASPIATNSLVIDFVEIATFGNAQDFGDMTIPTRVIHGASDSHGGLGGF